MVVPEEEEEVEGQGQTFSISIEDGALEVEMEETTRNSLIGVLVVIVLVFACTGAAATAVLCCCGFGTATKTTLDIQQKLERDAQAKKNNQMNASESQLEVDNQYVLPDEIDIDIFASKKRPMKVNQDDMATAGATNGKIETTKPQSAESGYTRVRKSNDSTNSSSDPSRMSVGSG